MRLSRHQRVTWLLLLKAKTLEYDMLTLNFVEKFLYMMLTRHAALTPITQRESGWNQCRKMCSSNGAASVLRVVFLGLAWMDQLRSFHPLPQFNQHPIFNPRVPKHQTRGVQIHGVPDDVERHA